MSAATTFTDAATPPRDWTCRISANELKAVKAAHNVNLYDALGGELFARLAADPVLLVDVLYTVCKDQADSRGVTDEQFGASLVGDSLDAAASALIAGIIEFFPSAKRGVLNDVQTKLRAAESRVLALTRTVLDSGAVEKAIDAALADAAKSAA